MKQSTKLPICIFGNEYESRFGNTFYKGYDVKVVDEKGEYFYQYRSNYSSWALEIKPIEINDSKQIKWEELPIEVREMYVFNECKDFSFKKRNELIYGCKK